MAADSWSLRGVDRRTRETALNAARKEGITVGEWINRRVLSDEEAAQQEARGGAHDSAESGDLAQQLDRLSRRIEAAEHRSTLAITGIDQSVLGLISRLQGAEETQGELSRQHEQTLLSLQEAQDALTRRIKSLEADDADDRNLEALKSLEASLAQVSAQVASLEGQTQERLHDAETGVGRVGDDLAATAAKLEQSLGDLSSQLEAEAEKTDLQLRRVKDDFERALEKRDGASGQDVRALEDAIAQVSERLLRAEDLTNNAMRALEATFASLDERVRFAEGQLDALPRDVERDAAERLATVETRLDERIDGLREAVDEEARAAARREDSLRRLVETSAREGAETLERLVADRVSEAIADAADRARGIEDALRKDIADAAANADAHTAEELRRLSTELERRADEVTSGLEARLDDIARTAESDLNGLEGRLGGRIDDVAKEAADKIEGALEKAEDARARAAARLDSLQNDVRSALGRIDDTQIRVDDLGDKLVNVDDRLSAASDRIETIDRRGELLAERIESQFDDRFERLGRELAKTVSETRSDIARHLEAAADNPQAEALEQLNSRVSEAETRHSKTLDRIGEEVARMAGAVEGRIRQSERRAEALAREGASFADLDRLLETRLREIEASGAHAISRVGEELSRVAERLQDRLASSEKRASEAFEEVSSQVARISERLSERHNQTSEDIGRRLKDSEDRTSRLVEEAVAGVYRRVEESQDQTAAALSPVQVALSKLTNRLESIEDEAAPGFADGPAPLSDFEDLPPPFEPEPPPPPAEDDAGEADDPGPFAKPAEAGDLEALDDAIAGDPPPFEPEDFDPDNEPERREPLLGEDSLLPPFEYPDDEADARSNDETDGDADADADAPKPSEDSFLNAARRAAQATVDSKGRATNREAMPGFGPAQGVAARERRSRPLLMAASGMAFLAVGAAFYMVVSDAGRRAAEADAAGFDDLIDDVERNAMPNRAGSAPAPAPMSQPVDYADEAPPMPSAPVVTGAIPAPAADAPLLGDALLGEPGDATASGSPLIAPPAVEPPPPPLDAAAETATEASPSGVDATTPVEATPDAAPTPEPADAPPPAEQTPVEAATDVADIAEPSAPSEPSSIVTAAASGDPIAQYQLGMTRLDAGDVDEAAQLIRQAAENGLAPAQYRLARLYETGRGVEQNIDEARRWTERAATAGHRNSMHNLGIFYAEGRGAPQNFADAARWFEQAAQLGARDSQYNLGVLHEQGLGVAESLSEAYYWYAVAGRSGDADAQTRASSLALRLDDQALERAQARVEAFRAQRPDEEANGVFGDLPWSRPQLSGAPAIARAQTLLNQLGYDAGEPDGLTGPRTNGAVVAYQRANGLAQTGRVDSQLVQRLEADAAR